MSEFKFNCPVCGQHIATDSSASGAQIECPTCFQQIIVPPAPKADSKYILSATQCIKPQPVPRSPPAPGPGVARRRSFAPELFVALLFLCITSVAIYLRYPKNSRLNSTPRSTDSTNSVAGSSLNKAWRLNLAGVSFPDETVAGKVLNKDFACERAYLQNGALALRQGSVHQPEVVVNVYFSAREPQELEGRRFNFGTNDSGITPRIVLRWKQNDLRMAQAFTNGYAMKLEFDQIAAGQVPGRIYLCVPDVSKSFVAGTFTAEIRKPSFPWQR